MTQRDLHAEKPVVNDEYSIIWKETGSPRLTFVVSVSRLNLSPTEFYQFTSSLSRREMFAQ